MRRRLKVLPGLYVNVGKKGMSSVSVGRRGFTTSISKSGVRRTIGIPGTGISHTSFQPFDAQHPDPAAVMTDAERIARENRQRLQVRGAYTIVAFIVFMIVLQFVRAFFG
jgi:hypothetical protein